MTFLPSVDLLVTDNEVFGTFQALAKSLMTAALDLPSSGGAVTWIISSIEPCAVRTNPVILSSAARGVTRS